MKKFIGWFLIVCGIFSLPSFLIKLTQAHHGYEFFGMLTGQGLIFFLAYLCLRKETSEPESNSQNNIAESNDTSEKDESSSFVPVSAGETLVVASSTHDNSDSIPSSQKSIQPTESLLMNNAIVDYKPIYHDLKPNNEESINFPQIDYLSISWKEIVTLLFEYQKAELLKKCNPSAFMNPYNHDKVQLANTISIKLKDAICLKDLKILREMAFSLGIKVSTLQIYDYLKTICNPTNFTESEDLFSAANNLYSRVLESKNDISELENILKQAEVIIPLKSDKVKVPVNEGSNKPTSKTKIAIMSVCGIWTCAHLFMWAYKGVLYNATSYFFPFQTLNIRKYDCTEFLIYGVAVPAIVFGVGKLVSNLKK